MTLTSIEISNSQPVAIVGQDENLAADVVAGQNGFNRLAVDARITSVGGGSIPLLTSKYRVDWLESDIQINGSMLTVYSYAGSGYLHGFHLDTDSDKLVVNLLVDGEYIFQNVSIKFLKDLQFTVPNTSFQNKNVLSGIDNKNFDFSPPFAIYFQSSVVIQASTSNGDVKKIQRYLISITKNS